MMYGQQGAEFGLKPYRDAIQSGYRPGLLLPQVGPLLAAFGQVLRRAAAQLGSQKPSIDRHKLRESSTQRLTGAAEPSL
jgi:hypothetical protein